jgi:hypothetical protein
MAVCFDMIHLTISFHFTLTILHTVIGIRKAKALILMMRDRIPAKIKMSKGATNEESLTSLDFSQLTGPSMLKEK